MPARLNISVGFDMFFDRRAVRRAVGRGKRRALSRGGAIVRKTAQRSMRYTKSQALQRRERDEGRRKRMSATRHAPPGRPPRAVRPHPLLRKLLFYGYDSTSETVVVGPLALGRAVVPGLHEFGGSRRGRNPRRRLRRVGGGGEVRIGGRRSATSSYATDRRGRTVLVTYARLRTPEEARRANRLNRRLYGPLRLRRRYEPRPYMRPAMLRQLSAITEAWRDAVTK